jgi:glycosyltransferase involved in cell wall biosynthesis
MTSSPRALIFAPPPPPPGGLPGGIAAITAMLMRELGERGDTIFASPVRKEHSGQLGLRRAAVNIARLISATRRIDRRSSVLVFSSAGFSFWEKCVWSLVVRSTGRTVAIVMVDGNFPRYFAGLPSPLRWLARMIFRGRGFVLGAQSPSWRQYYREIFPAARVEQVTASADREFFEPRPLRPENIAGLRVLYVGWIIEAKGVLDLLDAAALVAVRSTRRFHVRLVGPVLDDIGRWQGEIDRRGLAAIVALAGSVNDRASLIAEYRAADVFVFPSHFEGFPVALVEAAAVGLPSVGTRVGGVPDILDDGRAGLVVAPHAPEELAVALRTLIEDDHTRAILGAALAEHARQFYMYDACGRSYLRLLGLAA